MSDCLIIVDVQNGFLNEKTKYIPEKINDLLATRHFAHVVATRYRNYPNSSLIRFMDWDCLLTDEEQAIPDEIARKVEHVFDKNCYTCFTDEFCDFVKSNDIDELYIVGIETECCVLISAIDAFQRNIRPIVLANYCASTGGDECHRAGLLVLERTIGKEQIEYK